MQQVFILSPADLLIPGTRYLARIKDVAALRLEVPPLINTLSTCFMKWSTEASQSRLRREDAITTAASQVSDLFVEHLGKLIEKICNIARRDQAKYSSEDTTITAAIQSLSIASSSLHRVYEGPGRGRHDNDFARIEDIRIVPTHQELVAEKVRFLEFTATCINAYHLFYSVI
jgi:hypothetical protein